MKVIKAIVFLIIMLFSINQGKSQVSIKKKNILGDWTTIDLELDHIGLDTMERVELDWYVKTVNNILLQKDTLQFFTSDVTNITLRNDVYAYFSMSLKRSGKVSLQYHMGYSEPPRFYSVHNYKWKIQKDQRKKYLVITYSPLSNSRAYALKFCPNTICSRT